MRREGRASSGEAGPRSFTLPPVLCFKRCHSMRERDFICAKLRRLPLAGNNNTRSAKASWLVSSSTPTPFFFLWGFVPEVSAPGQPTMRGSVSMVKLPLASACLPPTASTKESQLCFSFFFDLVFFTRNLSRWPSPSPTPRSPAPLLEPLLVHQGVAVDADHRLSKTGAHLSQDLGVVVVGHRLHDGLGPLGGITALEDTLTKKRRKNKRKKEKK